MIDPAGSEPRDLDHGRQIRFVVTPTGVRVAYATVGRGLPLVVPAAWIGHLEIAWQDPAIRVVAYDKPGSPTPGRRPRRSTATWRCSGR